MKKIIKHLKDKIKYYVLGSFIVLNMFIAGQALLSSQDSAEVSATFSGFLSAFFHAIGPEEAKIVEPESITISGPDLVIIGQSRRLTPTISPAETTDKSVYWSSTDTEVLDVTTGGIVVAKGIGTATIRATTAVTTIYEEVTIQVMDFPNVSSFELETLDDSIDVGLTTKIKLTDISPDLAKITSVSWTSLHPSIASVNEWGIVKGLSVGTATIVAAAGTYEKTMAITVNPNTTPVVDPTELTIIGNPAGSIYRDTQLSVDFGDVTPTDTAVTWLSSDINIARVDDNGKVYGYKFEGDVTITAISHADTMIRDTFTMTFTKVYPTSVTLRVAKQEVMAGHTMNIYFDFDPSETYDRQLVWTSSDPTIASISSRGEYGLFVAKKMGNVTITAVSTMDNTVSATIEMTVIKASTLNQEQERDLYMFVRKSLGHYGLFFANGILGYLTIFYFLKGKKHHSRYLLVSLGIGLILSLTLEWLQFLAPGRSPLISDSIINFIGYLTANLIIFVIFIVKIWRHNRANITAD